MSDETPNPGSEAGKVQPKKETVRINLPPKPTAAPTVRLPAPAAGGVAAPKAAAAAPAAKAAAAPAAKTAAAAPAPAAAAPPSPAGAMPPRAGAPARRAPQAASSPLDSILAVVAAIAGAATLVVTILMSMME